MSDAQIAFVQNTIEGIGFSSGVDDQADAIVDALTGLVKEDPSQDDFVNRIGILASARASQAVGGESWAKLSTRVKAILGQ